MQSSRMFRKTLTATLAVALSYGVAVSASSAAAQSEGAAPALPKPAASAPRMKPLQKTEKPESQASAMTTASVAKPGAAAGVASKSGGRCTRLAFEVNDYGKDGPTKDAKSLLDTHIAKCAAHKGIKKYTVGKKSVDCKLFLDFIVFDEHTCNAEPPLCC